MDSVSQIVLGASVAGICAPPRQRRKALLIGAALGTLPDLDVLIDYGDPVSNFTYHRGFSHSFFVLFPFAVFMWQILRRWLDPVRENPWRWFAAITLALLTHPLLDAHTVYGTQLLWPMSTPPVMWSTLFIIDPLYTLPLLAGVVFATFRANLKSSGIALALGLIVSTSYIGWTWAAKSIVEHDARLTLHEIGLAEAPRFSVPTPFNTLLWRVVVLTEDGYLEGFKSLVADAGPMRFQSYMSDHAALLASQDVWSVKRLRWFAHDFLKSEVMDDVLILSDLRMGVEPKYMFSHAVARRGNPHWRAIPPRRIPAVINPAELRLIWERIWKES